MGDRGKTELLGRPAIEPTVEQSAEVNAMVQLLDSFIVDIFGLCMYSI